MNQNFLQFNQINQNAGHLPQNIMTGEHRSCFKCSWEGETAEKTCPKCGKPAFTQANIRTRGTIMIVIGLFLSGLMSAITVLATSLLAEAAKKPGAVSRFDSEPHLFVLMYVIFGGVIAAGVAAILNGIWMVVYGRRNMFLLYFFLGLIGVVLIAGGIFTSFVN